MIIIVSAVNILQSTFSRYLKGVTLNYFPESCNPEDYELTVIFSELIFLADSSIPTYQEDSFSSKTRIQKKSGGNQIILNDQTQYYLQPRERNDFSRKNDKIRRYVNFIWYRFSCNLDNISVTFCKFI